MFLKVQTGSKDDLKEVTNSNFAWENVTYVKAEDSCHNRENNEKRELCHDNNPVCGSAYYIYSFICFNMTWL